jgi:hypothetical protein
LSGEGSGIQVENSQLILVSITTSTLSLEEKTALWSFVVELSIEQQADSYKIDPVVWKGPGEKQGLKDLLARDTPAGGLRPIDDLASVVVEVGPTVMNLNLYSKEGWVAGVSDWGDDIDVLLETDVWFRLKPVLEAYTPRISFDITEAEGRPPPVAGRARGRRR